MSMDFQFCEMNEVSTDKKCMGREKTIRVNARLADQSPDPRRYCSWEWLLFIA